MKDDIEFFQQNKLYTDMDRCLECVRWRLKEALWQHRERELLEWIETAHYMIQMLRVQAACWDNAEREIKELRQQLNDLGASSEQALIAVEDRE